ncbi:hypothetical protein [Micromonospora okii]|uniref:hypothetical protein n=1 Tax=Micromonospora okii TaxID=1182970 RepID=UPI001E2B98BC|nr:hypothetical protein [Micromonospora okii]
MSLEFYSTTAQVLPVLMLALIWESRFLEKLSDDRRLSRREDPIAGVRFWTRPRVRAYSISVAAVLLGGTGVAVLVLAGAVPDAPAVRAALTGCMVLALATLLTRIVVDVVAATARLDPPEPAATAARLDAPAAPAAPGPRPQPPRAAPDPAAGDGPR